MRTWAEARQRRRRRLGQELGRDWTRGSIEPRRFLLNQEGTPCESETEVQFNVMQDVVETEMK